MTDFSESLGSYTSPRQEVLLSMFSDALGREVTLGSEITPEEELSAGAEVQGRIDTVEEQVRRMREGEAVDIDALMDSKAQLAMLETWIETRHQ